MNLMSMNGVEKAYRNTPLFTDVSFGIDTDDRIGLVGRNGAGKSVLLDLIADRIQPDAGTIARKRSIRLAMLEQTPSGDADCSLRSFLHHGEDYHIRLHRDYTNALERAGQSPSDDKELTRLTSLMEETNGFHMTDRYLSLLAELGMDDPDAKIGSLSGGMLRKAAIARCLAGNPELVLLDEPTNHLDIETIEWLETYLGKTDAAIVLVTHDRYVLESVCNSILEIDSGQVYRYPCSYAAYLERRKLRYDAADSAENRRQVQLAAELKWLERGARARTGKEKARKDRVQQLESGQKPRERTMTAFTSTPRRLGKKVLETAGVCKSYDGQTVVAPFSYRFERKEKLGVIGPNGSGKSTFLDLLAGVVTPDGGEVDIGENTSIAYFDQAGDRVDGSLTVIEYLKAHAERVRIDRDSWITVEQFLERFLFPRSMFNQSLELLSGGEFRRLFLVRLLAAGPNCLLLDEPTNDLDIDTIRLLEEFLIDFPGCVIAVSHDRAFLDRVTEGLLVFSDQGKVRKFSGNYSDLAEERELTSKREKAETTSSPKTQRHVTTRRLSFHERRELAQLPDEIAALESERTKLEALFVSGSTDVEKMNRAHERYVEVCREIESKGDRWLELAEIDE